MARPATRRRRSQCRAGWLSSSFAFVQILILGAGASLVIDGQLTSGAMIAASILLGRALAPVEQAIGAWKGMIAARDAYDRLKRLLERVPAEQGAMPLPAPKCKFELRAGRLRASRMGQAGAQRRASPWSRARSLASSDRAPPASRRFAKFSSDRGSRPVDMPAWTGRTCSPGQPSNSALTSAIYPKM